MAIKKVINVEVNTDKANKNIKGVADNVNTETSKISNGLGGLTGTLDKFTGGAVTKIKGLTSSLGGVSMGFKSIGVAIAASGIGLLITMIAAVTAAFKSSEEGQNKFAKIMGVIGSVVGNLMDLLSDFGEVIIEAFENPKKAWNSFTDSLKTGYEFIKGQIIDRFLSNWTLLSGGIEAGILKMRIAWNEFTGDSEEAEQLKTQLQDVQTEMIKAVDVINQRNQEIVNGFNNAIDKVKEFGKEIEEDAKKAQAIADQRANADKKERDLIVARAIANREVANLREKAMQRENYTLEERIKLLEEAGKIEENITNREIIAARLRAEAKTAENALSKSTKEDLKEEEELKARVIDLETARLRKQKELTSQIAGFREQEKAAREAEEKAKEDALAKEQEIETQRLEAIQAIRDEYKKKIEDANAESEIEKLALEEERKIAELEALRANEEEKAEVRAFYEMQRTELEEKEAEERKRIALEEKEYKASILNAEADLLSQFGGFLKQIGEKNKALAVAGIIAEQIASGAKIISNTGIANAKAVAAFPLTGGQPWVGINTISAGISIASGAAAAAKAISKLGGGGNADSSQGVEQNNNGNRSQAPNFNLIGSGGINSIAQSLNQRNQQPVKAYVVAKEMSTQQELNRNIEDTASI